LRCRIAGDRLGAGFSGRTLAGDDIDDTVALEIDGVARIHPAVDGRPLPLLSASRVQFLLRLSETGFDLGHAEAARRTGTGGLLLDPLDQQCVGAGPASAKNQGKQWRNNLRTKLHNGSLPELNCMITTESATKNRPEAVFLPIKPRSTLARLEPRIGFADHEDLPAAADHLAVAVTGLGRLQRGQNFHNTNLYENNLPGMRHGNARGGR
jgi:hypothetical protein